MTTYYYDLNVSQHVACEDLQLCIMRQQFPCDVSRGVILLAAGLTLEDHVTAFTLHSCIVEVAQQEILKHIGRGQDIFDSTLHGSHKCLTSV